MTDLLEINNLIVSFQSDSEETLAVKGASLCLGAGETLALVGESGCGKTVLCKSILRILDDSGNVRGGHITLKSGTSQVNLTHMSEKDILPLRSSEIAMVFQDPMTNLNPAFSVGDQIAEVIRIHGVRRKVLTVRLNAARFQPPKQKRHRTDEACSYTSCGIPLQPASLPILRRYAPENCNSHCTGRKY